MRLICGGDPTPLRGALIRMKLLRSNVLHTILYFILQLQSQTITGIGATEPFAQPLRILRPLARLGKCRLRRQNPCSPQHFFWGISSNYHNRLECICKPLYYSRCKIRCCLQRLLKICGIAANDFRAPQLPHRDPECDRVRTAHLAYASTLCLTRSEGKDPDLALRARFLCKRHLQGAWDQKEPCIQDSPILPYTRHYLQSICSQAGSQTSAHLY